MRVLISTKIFPNQALPGSAPFNRQQFLALGRLPGVEVVDVLATIPSLPLLGPVDKGQRGVPVVEQLEELSVRHPRTWYLPKLDRYLGLSGYLHLASLLPLVPRYKGRVDVLLGAWAYPDGCAAVQLGALLGIPVVVKLHGSDINLLGTYGGPRAVMRRLLPQAQGVVAVSAALRAQAVALGVPAERVEVVRNGVDGSLFRPYPLGERSALRAALGLRDVPTVVCVGRVEEAKGVGDLLEAFRWLRQRMGEVQLCVVGKGGALGDCQRRAGEGVHFPGAVALPEVPRWLGAADVVAMPSWAEGVPNTILEAHACGRPVVATAVGGIPEVLDQPCLGRLVPPRSPVALGEALLWALGQRFSPADIQAAAHAGSWEQSAAALRSCLAKAVGRPVGRQKELRL